MPEITNQEYENKIKELKEKITPEFLETLSECARIVGWGIDYTEVINFIESIYGYLDIDISSKDLANKLDPYEIEYNSIYVDLTKGD